MENKMSDTHLKNKFSQMLNSSGAERRKQSRRAQSDRREIERFGYDKMTRRANNDRRTNRDVQENN